MNLKEKEESKYLNVIKINQKVSKKSNPILTNFFSYIRFSHKHLILIIHKYSSRFKLLFSLII